MTYKHLLLSVMAISMTVSPCVAITPSEAELQQCREWVQASLVGKASFPFRFVCDGQSSVAILPTWEVSTSEKRLDATRVERVTVFREPNNRIEVRLKVRQFDDFPAVEWVLHMKNIGDTDAPIVEKILPLWMNFLNPEEDAPFDVRYALGSHNRSDDFQLRSTRILSASEGLNFSSYGGRSSDGCLPFFNLHHASGGVMLGLGWTGDWTMRFHRPQGQSLAIVAGMPHTRIRLAPGEEIRSPGILLTFWQGDEPIRGHNLQRALLRKYYSPVAIDESSRLPVAVSPHAEIPFEGTTEQNVLEVIARIVKHQLPVNTWWIDTGWFEMVDNHWAKSVGNFVPDPVRFPNGMKPIADAAHAAGWRFLLWQEPERVMPRTWLYENHPEWIIAPPQDMPFPVKYMYEDRFHLLKLGDPEALNWLIEETSGLIANEGIDIYRNDCNIYPGYYWKKDEPVDRAGLNEIKYVMGLYRWWDELLSRHPGLLIDNCASGGRRIDFEMLRRSVVLWRSDVGFGSPIANQSISYGLAHWIPLWGGGGDALDSYRFRSTLGPACVLSAKGLLDEESLTSVGPIVEQYRAVRHLTEEDFYPLTPCSLRDDQWVAWQYNSSDRGEGLVQAFRRKNAVDDSMTLRLQGLYPSRRYAIRDLDAPGDGQSKLGSELMGQGLQVKLAEPRAAALFHYKKTSAELPR